MRKSRQKRRDNGLCIKCGEVVLEDMALCEKHQLKQLGYQNKIRNKRKKSGLCYMCGKRPPAENRVRCSECLEYKKLEYHRNRAPIIKKRIKNHLCVSCGNSNESKNKLCDSCSDKYNANARLKYEKRKQSDVCPRCGINPPKNNCNQCTQCLEKETVLRNKPNIVQRSREKRQKIKKQIMDKYGGKCNCCGETGLSFLNIDHINDDGKIHRKQIRQEGGSDFYKWLINNNFPDGFQVLCYSCNISKYRNGGTCAHKLTTVGV